MANNDPLTITQSTELMFSMLGIILPLAVLIDLLLDKNRKNNQKKFFVSSQTTQPCGIAKSRENSQLLTSILIGNKNYVELCSIF